MQEGNEKKPSKAFFQRYNDFCKKHAFDKRIVTIFLVLVLLLFGFLTFKTIKDNSRYTSRTVEFGLRNIGELASQAGYFTSVQTIKGSRELFGITIPFTQSQYIYSFDGIVKAGIDFQKIAVDANDATKVITVKLPHATILDVVVDQNSLVVYDQSKNIFSPLKLENVQESTIIMKEEVKQKAIDNQILVNAEKNAELLISGFLQGVYPSETYKIQFDWQ